MLRYSPIFTSECTLLHLVAVLCGNPDLRVELLANIRQVDRRWRDNNLCKLESIYLSAFIPSKTIMMS